MRSNVTKIRTEPEVLEASESDVRRNANIYVLNNRASVLNSGSDFQRVDDIVDRITERAHRVAGY